MESTRHPTHLFPFQPRPQQKSPTLISVSPPRELRVDRRVRADLAEISYTSIDLSSGELRRADDLCLVSEAPALRSRLAGNLQGDFELTPLLFQKSSQAMPNM